MPWNIGGTNPLGNQPFSNNIASQLTGLFQQQNQQANNLGFGGTTPAAAPASAPSGGTAPPAGTQNVPATQAVQTAPPASAPSGGAPQGGLVPWTSLTPQQQQDIMAAAAAAGIGWSGVQDWYNSGNYVPSQGGGAGGATGGGGAATGGGAANPFQYQNNTYGDPVLPGFSPEYPQPPGTQQLLDFLRNPAGQGNELYGPLAFSALPGSSEFGEETMRSMANLLAMLTSEQRGRSAESEGIYRNLANTVAPASTLSDLATITAHHRLDPASLSGYRDQLRSQAASDAGQGYQTSMQRMRDAGLLGRGGMSVDPALAASNLANEGLARRNLDIEGLMEQITQSRLGQANELARGGADVYQNTRMIPQYNLAQRMDQPASTGDQALLQFLYDQAMLAATGSQAQRNAPTGFERIGVPIIGGALSGASGLGDLMGSLKDLFD